VCVCVGGGLLSGLKNQVCGKLSGIEFESDFKILSSYVNRTLLYYYMNYIYDARGMRACIDCGYGGARCTVVYTSQLARSLGESVDRSSAS
jgi:hypothetical protein